MSAWSPLRRLYPYWAPHRRTWALAMAALVLVHLLETGVPACLKIGIDRMAAQDHRLLEPVLAILLLSFLRGVFLSLGRRRNALVSIEIISQLRLDLYAHLQRQGAGFYGRHRVGDLMTRSTSDTEAIRRLFRFAINQLVSLAGITLIAPCFMAGLSASLTALLLPFFVIMVAGGWRLAGQIREQANVVQAELGHLTETVQQNLKGIRTIQSHAQEDREIAHLARESDRQAAASARLNLLQSRLTAFMLGISTLMSLIVVGVGGSQVQAGTMSIGTLTAFIFYLGMILGAYSRCSAPVFALLSASAAAARVFQLMDEAPEIDDARADVRKQRFRGELLVDGVSFSHPGRLGSPGGLALDQVSLHIQAGELVAIMGRVGAGKSTLLRLLARLIEPNEGRVQLDGLDLATIPLASLRQAVALVAQDSYLFAAPMSENISYDDPERLAEFIWDAADTAHLGPTIRGFENGLDTPVGERGVTLSGGQKQRTTLARGLIREAEVLLLDDSFSALDSETEASIFAALRERRRGQTTVFVSHRPSTARQADRICVFEQGRLVESGRHEDLLRLNGHYARLCHDHAAPSEATA